jgi:hypothetical protein
MSNGAAVAAAIANAIKASGTIVRVEPETFVQIASKMKESLIVVSVSRFLGTSYRYLTSYKGLAFFTKSREQFILPSDAEVIAAQRIWIPGEL